MGAPQLRVLPYMNIIVLNPSAPAMKFDSSSDGSFFMEGDNLLRF